MDREAFLFSPVCVIWDFLWDLEFQHKQIGPHLLLSLVCHQERDKSKCGCEVNLNRKKLVKIRISSHGNDSNNGSDGNNYL